MSSILYWEPIKSPPDERSLSDKLKYALQTGDRFGEFSERDIPYLEGLRDAGIEDAQIIIDAIEKYSTVRLFVEY